MSLVTPAIMGSSSFTSGGSQKQQQQSQQKAAVGTAESTEYAPLSEGLHPSIPVPRVNLKVGPRSHGLTVAPFCNPLTCHLPLFAL